MPLLIFGAGGFNDVLIPADYDGDGKADIAVFRKGSSANIHSPTNFYIWQSLTNSLQTVQWGIGRDNPFITQDFDGDGKADPTVVRCADATQILPAMTWYILHSGSNYQTYRIETFGTCGGQHQDRPIRGDFDGDGKADLAFYRKFEIDAAGQPVRANRYYIQPSGSPRRVLKIRFDYAQDSFTIPADFDGDGKTDLAASRIEYTNGLGYRWWYWIRSSDGVSEARQFGVSDSAVGSTDSVAVGDYDGDGKTDLAVFRDSGLLSNQTNFYILGSRDGFMGVQWGIRNFDIPPALNQITGIGW